MERWLSSAATSIEDRGSLYEVRVATRTGYAARATRYRYPEGALVGSVSTVSMTETILVPDGFGLYTFRLRASRGEFETVRLMFREFLLQLVLGPPKLKNMANKKEESIPFVGGQP